MSRNEINERDLRIINLHADKLNREALDALEFQIPLMQMPLRSKASTMSKREDALIASYVDAMSRFDDRSVSFEAMDPWAWALADDATDDNCGRIWRPRAVVSSAADLNNFYARLSRHHPGLRFPSLYEKIVLGYRWARVEMDGYELLANPIGSGLGLLYDSLRDFDPMIFDILVPHGFVPFAKKADRHDPICFDLGSRSQSDCPIVSFDHETVHAGGGMAKPVRREESFRKLMAKTITAASAFHRA